VVEFFDREAKTDETRTRPDQYVVRRLDGNAPAVVEWLEQAGMRARSRPLHELVVTATARGSAAAPGFVRAARRAIDGIAKATRGITASSAHPSRRDLYNACFVLAHARCAASTQALLPNTASSTKTVLRAGDDLLLLRFGDVRIADDLRGHLAAGPPATDLALGGAQLIANISASPFTSARIGDARDVRVRAPTTRASSPFAMRSRQTS